jgi:hypothetical protein
MFFSQTGMKNVVALPRLLRNPHELLLASTVPVTERLVAAM